MSRVPYAERPLRYEYRLTEKGRAFWDVLAAMWRWGSDWLWEAKRPPVALVDRETEREVRPLVVDEHTGARLDVRRLRVRAVRSQPATPPTPRAVRAQPATRRGGAAAPPRRATGGPPRPRVRRRPGANDA